MDIPDHVLTAIRSFILPKWLGGKVAAFKATGKFSRSKALQQERDIDDLPRRHEV